MHEVFFEVKLGDKMSTDDAGSKGTKSELEASKRAIKKANKLINEFETRLASIEDSYNQKIKDANSLIVKIKETQAALDKSIVDSEDKCRKINDYYNELFVEPEDGSCTEDEISEFRSKIESAYEEAIKIHKNLEECFVDIFGEIKNTRREDLIEKKRKEGTEILEDDNGEYWMEESIVLGKKDEISNLIDEFTGLREKHSSELEVLKDKSQKRCESLFAEIEKLLPGATSSGLASAYKEAKETHEKIVTRWEFIFAIIVVALVVFPSAILIPRLGEIFSQSTVNFEMLVGRLLVLIPIELPLFWIGFKAIKVANQHRRISEEYRHKWAVASSFLGMRKQIAEISDEEDNNTMLEDLLANTILSHAENPSAIIADAKDYHHPLLYLLGESKVKAIAKTVGLTKGKEIADSAMKLCDALRELISSKQSTVSAINSHQDDEDGDEQA
jgi:hypothetical protein